MFNPTREYAESLLSEAAERRKRVSPAGFDEKSWRAHSFGVARLAAAVAARVDGLDPEKAFVLGMLHDVGKRWNEVEEHTFHALSGYYYLSAFGFKEAARICLTHSFLILPPRENIMPNPPDLVGEALALIDAIEYDDYDRLIQMCDWMNDCGEDCTIRQRARSIVRRYSQMPEERTLQIAQAAEDLKKYFDALCGADVYDICGLNASADGARKS